MAPQAVACRLAAPPDAGDDLLVVPCLGALAPADLIAAAACGVSSVELACGACDSCTDEPAGSAIHASVALARSLAARLGHAFTVTVRACPGGEPSPADTSPALSRRDAFAFVGRSVRRVAADVLTPPKPGVADLHAQAPPPAAHARLVADAGRLAAEHGRRWPAPAATVAVKADCDGCGLCVRYCPHGALSCEEGPPSLRPECCTACGLCAEVCPREALELCEEGVHSRGATAV